MERAASLPLSSPSSSPSPSVPGLQHLLTTSSAFLSSYLPPRLYHYHHTHHYHSYHPSITSLPSFSALSQTFHRLSRSDEWTATHGGGSSAPSHLSRFAAFTRQTLTDLEDVVSTLAHQLRDLCRSERRGGGGGGGGGADHPPPQLQEEVNRLLDTTYSLLIEMRLHLSHYAYADAVYTAASASPSTPVDARHIGLDYPIVTRCDLRLIAQRTIETARAACIEKWGDAPETILISHLPPSPSSSPSSSSSPSLSPSLSPAPPPPPLPVVGVAAHLHFILFELLKNCMKAVIDQHGVLHLHDAPPITVALSSSPTSSSSLGPAVGILLSDSGVGLSSLSPPHSLSPSPPSLFHYFFTTSKAHADEGSDWRYSRSFGSPLHRVGCGAATVSAVLQ